MYSYTLLAPVTLAIFLINFLNVWELDQEKVSKARKELHIKKKYLDKVSKQFQAT